MNTTSLFQSFKKDISEISLPEKFTFPFYYEPHELSIIAAKELQDYLENQSDFEHNFGLDPNMSGLVIGKMFGILVVEKSNGELGYLWAFSGKLADQNYLPYFVPPVFDTLKQDGFYKQGEVLLNQYNAQIAELEKDKVYLDSLRNLEATKLQAEKELSEHKEKSKIAKQIRDSRRIEAEASLEFEEYKILQKQLSKESQEESILFKKMNKFWKIKTEEAEQKVLLFQSKIENLKEERKTKSASLQQQLFENYFFLNSLGELESLGKIFEGNPPAGAGECAAPKLLHFAYQNNLKPIALAEFWWGQSPKSEVRKHKQFYPACTGKCKPILGHMLQGIETDENPLDINPAEGKDLEIVFEDEYLAVINKPAEFLSVPGKQITDSVYSRMKQKYPDAEGPLVVHRLDMSTSGLLLIAKSNETHKRLQYQFIKRLVKKRYVALLEGNLNEEKGNINLPLRVDLDNRPNQLVCFEYGKPAQTRWEIIKKKDNKTLVYFYPITGRTHQLRVHSAHKLGLNSPIVGDDLYGTKADRLHLHAESITFEHPFSREIITISVEPDF